MNLDALKNLKDGWYDGEGLAPKDEDVDWLKKCVDKYYKSDLPAYYVYPTPEGNVVIEWCIGNNNISLDINFTDKHGWFHCWNSVTDEENSEYLFLDKDEYWNRLIELIETYMK